jgi:hypothetical protein
MEEFILQAILKSLAGGGESEGGIKAFSPKNVLKNLGRGPSGSEDDEDSLKSFLDAPRNPKGGAPIYDPNKYYGGIYSMYGGRKVRGGLLGD